VPSLDPQRFRADWLAAMQFERDFYVDRPVAFSPAVAPQERANRSNMMWRWAPIWLPWEFTHWMDEGRSFHDTAYIGDWSGLTKVRVTGPQALDFLGRIGTNDLSAFEIGQIKHHIQTTPEGKVAAEGVLYRTSQNDFRYMGGNGAWMDYSCREGEWDAQTVVESPDLFIFEVQGPQSLPILEAATGESLRDIAFNRCRPTTVAGVDLLVLRTGISGELGYELHGPSEHAALVWQTVVEAGQEFGIALLGARAQIISHTEAGIATNTLDYITASEGTAGQSPVNNGSGIIGSAATGDVRDFFRSPYELGFGSRVAIDAHDFVGREALVAERDAGGPVRRLGGLVWNSDDVVDVFASLFRAEGPVPMEMPRIRTLEASRIVVGGEVVGCATSRVYSPHLRQMISLCHLDRRFLAPGTDVTVIWGDAGGPQADIRAEVIELPFKPDRRRIDVTSELTTGEVQ
jgi:glycine cleavage system aminomethyltransferase T